MALASRAQSPNVLIKRRFSSESFGAPISCSRFQFPLEVGTNNDNRS